MGTAVVFTVRGFDHLHLEVADITWDNGERSIETLHYVDGPTQFKRLAWGARLSVDTAGGGQRVDLRMHRVKLDILNRWDSAPRLVTLSDLDEATGIDCARLLRQAGASSIGARKDLIADTSTAKNYLCAIAPREERAMPIVAYALTRLLPIQHLVFDPETTSLDTPYEVPKEAKDGKGSRLYVILLEDGACRDSTPFDPGCCPDRGGRCVYVGETGKPREHRFREHLVGYRSSKWVRRYGVRLLPELWQGTRTGFPADEAPYYERLLALELAAKGHCVRGGH